MKTGGGRREQQRGGRQRGESKNSRLDVLTTTWGGPTGRSRDEKNRFGFGISKSSRLKSQPSSLEAAQPRHGCLRELLRKAVVKLLRHEVSAERRLRTCLFGVIGLDAADVRRLLGHEDLHELRQAGFELRGGLKAQKQTI